MNEIRIYVEGDPALREGFSDFLDDVRREAESKKLRLRPILCGGRDQTIEDFLIALRKHQDAWNILLIDSDGPDNGRLFEHLVREHAIIASLQNSVFWMVQVMESWFLADPDALELYYGQDFKRNSLKPNPKVEQILKKDVEDCLKDATRNTAAGVYHKTKHAPHILRAVDPRKVQDAAPNCRRLFDVVSVELAKL